MRSTTVPISDGPLAELDLVELGCRSGLLWSSPSMSLAGIGVAATIEVSRPEGGATAQAGLADLAGETFDAARPAGGPVGFCPLPFDRTESGSLIVPEMLLAESSGTRWLTCMDGGSEDEVAAAAIALLDEPASPQPSRIEIGLSRTASSWRDEIVVGARDRIRAGELDKAVMARELVLAADLPFPTADVVRRLHRRFGSAMVFSVDGFVGASPELLVAREGRTVRAHPLAGTAARGATPEDDAARIAELRASTKDQHEHRITIDWLLTELLPYCSYVDAEPEPSVVSLANVHHLATLVEGVLSEPAASILELVAAVHPTPAVGGDPQQRALEVIAELEGFDRGRYAGPVGWVDAAGNGEFAVGVRSAQLAGHEARVAAGVGVVAASDPEAELVETQTKFAAALGALLAAD